MPKKRITLREYAAAVGREHTCVLKKAQKGHFPSARLERLGGLSVWTIERDEPYIDNRRKPRV